MSMIIDEIVDYANKRVDTLYDDADSFIGDDQDDFYDHYEPFTNEEFNDGDDYEPFDPEAEEREYELSRIKQDRVLKPYAWMTSPTKTPKASPTKLIRRITKNTPTGAALNARQKIDAKA